jgi:hypothetical protein
MTAQCCRFDGGLIMASFDYNYATIPGDKKVDLADLKLVKIGDKYYLDATYDVETEAYKTKLHIPRIKLPIDPTRVKIHVDTIMSQNEVFANTGKFNFVVDRDENGNYYEETIVEEKVHALTLSEIESRLGYKVRVIAE